MIRRAIYILFFALLLLVIFLFYKRITDKPQEIVNDEVFNAVPSDAGVVLYSKSFPSFISKLKNQNLVWNSLLKTKTIKEISQKFTVLDSLLNDEPELKGQLNETAIVVSLQMAGTGLIAPLVVVEVSNSDIEDKIKSYFKKSYSGRLQKRNYDGLDFYYVSDSSAYSGLYVYKKYLVWSSSDRVLERSAREFSGGGGLSQFTSFQRLAATKGNNVQASVFINSNGFRKMLEAEVYPSFLKKIEGIEGRDGWVGADITLKSDLIAGIGYYDNQTKNYLSLLKMQNPKPLELLDYVPAEAQQLFAFGLSNSKVFREDYADYLSHQGLMEENVLWERRVADIIGLEPSALAEQIFSGEFLKVTYGGLREGVPEEYLLAKVNSKSLVEEEIKNCIERFAKNKNKSIKEFSGTITMDDDLSFSYYEFPIPELIEMLYGRFIESAHLKYYTFYDNTLIAANRISVLKEILYANILGKTLSRQAHFADYYDNLTSTCNFLWYQNCRSIPVTIKSSVKEALYQDLFGSTKAYDNLNGAGFQLSGGSDMPYFNIAIDYNVNAKKEPKTVWQSLLDTTMLMKPALVENHYTHEREIVVQDINHTLYLISPSGRILWKKKVSGPILSQIYQVDAYKNGKLQLLFNTADNLYLLDRNGRHVGTFPVRFVGKATSGLCLADYDATKAYRIFVPTSEKKILLLGIDGKAIKGWRFKSTDYFVESPVQHFRVNNKDYIVFADQKRIYITDRQGNPRVNLEKQFKKDPASLFYLEKSGPGGKAALLTMDNKGHLVSILFSGKVDSKLIDADLADGNWLMTNINGKGSLEVIVSKDKELKVYDQRGNLRFEKVFSYKISSQPSLYSFSNKEVKIGIVCKEEKSIYLLNKEGIIEDGFPLVGLAPFSIGLLNSGGQSFNLIVGGADSYLYNYLVK